jgi:DNA-binding MarR family transcriptional regulator
MYVPNMDKNTSDTSELYSYTGYWLNRFHGNVRIPFERRMHAHGVTVSQWMLLMTLFHGKADTVRNIAQVLRLDGGAVTRLADRLEGNSLVRRLPDPEDRRSVRLELTPEGRDLVPILAVTADAIDEEFIGVLSDDEVAQFKGLLCKMLRSANDPPDESWIDAPLKRDT